MAKRDKELWADLSSYLKRRKGWSLQPMSSPGAPPTWCYRSGAKISLQASVLRGAICVYVMEDDREVRFQTVEELANRLEGNRPAAPPEHMVAEEVEDLAHGRPLRWGATEAEAEPNAESESDEG